MLIGYARVSTQDQNLDLQIDALKKAGCAEIFCDKLSGAIEDRPELKKALNACSSGDILVVWKLDRLGRSLRHLISIISELGSREVGFKTCIDGIDTTTNSGLLVFHIFAALAQFERSLIKERTLAGLEAARSRGKVGGRPRAMDKQKIEIAKKLISAGARPSDVANMMGVSSTTLWRYLR